MDEDSLASLREEVEADPNDPDRHMRLARALFEHDRYGEASASSQRALKLGQESVDTRLLLGKSLMRQGNPMEAAFQFEQLLARHPEHEEATACLESLRRITAVVEAIRRLNPRELQIEVRNHVVVLRFSGMMAPLTEDGDFRESYDRLTMAMGRLLAMGHIGCIVDLTSVHFVTSFFLGKLMEWRRKLIGNTRAMVVCGAREEIRELLVSTRLSKVMVVVDTMEEAMRVATASVRRSREE